MGRSFIGDCVYKMEWQHVLSILYIHTHTHTHIHDAMKCTAHSTHPHSTVIQIQIVKGSMDRPKIVCLLFNYVYGLAFVWPCACGIWHVYNTIRIHSHMYKINVEITFRHFISDATTTFAAMHTHTTRTTTKKMITDATQTL